MRFVLYILTIYTVVLSCLPCQDAVGHVTSVYVSSVSNEHADSHPSADVDLCSPFCICACCAGITLQDIFTSLPDAASKVFYRENTFIYAPGSPGRDLKSIWQPPRI